MGKKMIKKIFLEDLPRIKEGRNIGKINWESSIGYKVKFIYDNIEGEIEIVEMTNIRPKKLIIKYKDVIFKDNPIAPSHLRECKIGFYLGKITGDFKIPLGKYICKDDRDLIILETKINNEVKGCKKYYKYKCNKCKNEDWMAEGNLIGGKGCNACCVPPQKTVLGINTIWDTDRWMVDLGVSEEDAKGYLPQSNDKVEVICPDCGRSKLKFIYDIYHNKSISCTCGDGFSYPSKFMFNVLTQLNIKFETEYSPDYLIRIENDKNSRKFSDFYLPDYNLIVETDGKMGHEGGLIHSKSDSTLEECVEIDKWKDEQHRLNGVETIRINCFKSDVGYIKNSILNSELANYFDLSKIDWMKCEEFALSNLVREVCNYWDNKEEWETTTDLANFFNFSKTTIRRYLNLGAKSNWCKYRGYKELKKTYFSGKPVEIFKDNISLGLFDSAIGIERQSEELFGVKLNNTWISAVCKGDKPQYKGFTFKYTQSEEQSQEAIS